MDDEVERMEVNFVVVLDWLFFWSGDASLWGWAER